MTIFLYFACYFLIGAILTKIGTEDLDFDTELTPQLLAIATTTWPIWIIAGAWIMWRDK